MKIVPPTKSQIAFRVILPALTFLFLLSPLAAFAQKTKIKQTILPAPTNINFADDYSMDELEIFALVNQERIKRGLNALVYDAAVAEIARAYSKKMASENFFSHYDGAGNNVVERATRAHLKHWSEIGENLFSIANLAKFDAFAVKNWMRSPTHRQNILDADFTTAGVGIARSESGEIFITQVFIKR